jgi:hypothetical protein
MLGVCLKCNNRPQVVKNARLGGYQISCRCGVNTLMYPNLQLAKYAWNEKNKIKYGEIVNGK